MQAQISRDTEYSFDDVSVVMGTYNEERAIQTVITAIESATNERAEIICVDGSSDRTPNIAKAHDATVIHQEPQGYGIALRRAFRATSRPVIITTDCDATYPMDQLPAFLAAINDGYDVVSGNRFANGVSTMPRLNRYGNNLFARVASVLTGNRVADTTTGMRAYRRDVIDTIEWTGNTGLSAELLMRPIMRGYRVCELPIEYRDRLGDTTLNPLTGGAAIAASIVRVWLDERRT